MQKICAIDLDGVLAEYPNTWVNFANNKLNTNYDLHELKDKISFNEYRALKEKYRTCGIKATIPVMTGARDLILRLRKKGFMIIILTARPLFQYKEVLRDTIFWLKNNDIEHDLLFWGKDKDLQIIKYFSDLNFMVEDNAEIANKIAKFGYKVYLLDNQYNQQSLHENVERIYSLEEIQNDKKND